MKKTLLLLTFSSLLVGCASTSDNQESLVEIVNIPLQPSDMDLSEKNEILTLIMQEQHLEKPFSANPHPSRSWEKTSSWSGNRITYKGGTNMNYSYTFKVDENNHIVKEIYNVEWHGNNQRTRDCMLCLDNGFNSYVDTFIAKAAEQYNDALGTYQLSVERHKKLEEQLKVLMKNTTIKINSPIKLDTDVTKIIEDSVKLSVVPGRLRFSKKEGIYVVEPYVSVESNIPSSIERIRSIHSSISTSQLKVGDEPVVSVTIDSAVYDMLPSSFVGNDNNVQVQLENGTLKLTNRTNNFINIEAFTIYWGDNVTTVDNVVPAMAPQSVITKDISKQFDVFKSPNSYGATNNPRYTKFEETRTAFPFGLALSYYNVDTNKRNTLFKRKTYTRSDLN